jgi:hypothetical protein
MGEQIRVSRRKLLESMGAAAGIGMTRVVAGQSPARTRTGSPPRALALVGDRYHNADYIRTALNRLFLEVGVPIVFTISFAEIDAAHLEGFQLLVAYRDGLNWPNGYLQPDDYAYSSSLENSGDWPKEQYQGWITEEQGN